MSASLKTLRDQQARIDRGEAKVRADYVIRTGIVRDLAEQGYEHKAIGEAIGVSGQRISQIVSPDSADDSSGEAV